MLHRTWGGGGQNLTTPPYLLECRDGPYEKGRQGLHADGCPANSLEAGGVNHVIGGEPCGVLH